MKVNQDTRTIKRGEWFVVVKGERYDGHDFISEAFQKGAARVLGVEELYRLAEERTRKLKPKVIAVTGSYGKTTTKEAIYKVLSSRFKVLRTSGNLNTPLGVALEVVNNLKPSHEIFVVEVGMDRLGEIRRSCSMIKPQVGVVTSVGEMHLEKLGTLADIKAAKSELLESLPPNGVAILNYDDVAVRKIAERFGGETVWYGFSSRVGVNHSQIANSKLRLLGRGNKYAALAAYAVGQLFGVPEEEILKALVSLRSQRGRLNLLSGRNGAKIIDDSYNAGPQSVKVALEVLGEFSAQRRIAVLGDMLELGKLEKKAHCEAINTALKVSDWCILVGPRYAEAAVEANPLKPVEVVGDTRKAIMTVKKLGLGRGDVVLVKGSQGMRMERIVRDLLKDKSKAPRFLVRQDPRWI